MCLPFPLRDAPEELLPAEREIMTKGKVPLVRSWTREEDTRLLQMVEQNRHRALIAASLKRTIKAVTGRLGVLRREQGKR
jgi:hypothetical protein